MKIKENFPIVKLVIVIHMAKQFNFYFACVALGRFSVSENFTGNYCSMKSALQSPTKDTAANTRVAWESFFCFVKIRYTACLDLFLLIDDYFE